MTLLNHIVDAKSDQITPAQFAIDGEVEQCKFSGSRCSCSRIRIAQISFSFSGGFWPSSLPLFHGIARLVIVAAVSMNSSSVEERSFMFQRRTRRTFDATTSCGRLF